MKELGDHYQVEGPDPTQHFFVFFLLFEKKQNRLVSRRGSMSKRFDDHYLVKGLDPKPLLLFLTIFEKNIRPSLRRGSTSKRFDDHYHVEGPDLTNHFFYYFLIS